MAAVLRIRNLKDAREARRAVRDLAETVGLPDPAMVALAAGEIATNSAAYRTGDEPALVGVDAHRGRLVVRAVNHSDVRPSWVTRKPRVALGTSQKHSRSGPAATDGGSWKPRRTRRGDAGTRAPSRFAPPSAAPVDRQERRRYRARTPKEADLCCSAPSPSC